MGTPPAPNPPAAQSHPQPTHMSPPSHHDGTESFGPVCTQHWGHQGHLPTHGVTLLSKHDPDSPARILLLLCQQGPALAAAGEEQQQRLCHPGAVPTG